MLLISLKSFSAPCYVHLLLCGKPSEIPAITCTATHYFQDIEESEFHLLFKFYEKSEVHYAQGIEG